MLHSCLFSALAVVLLAAVSGCAGPPGPRAGAELSAHQVPLPEIPAPARITLETLTAGGEIQALAQKEIDGRVIYHVEASVNGEVLMCDLDSDGTVLAAGDGLACAVR